MASLALVSIFLTAGIAFARPVTAVWDRNTDGHTVGYRLYYGPSSGSYSIQIDVGNAVSHPLNLIPGIPHYFIVRAYNAAGVLGASSNEFPVTLPNGAPVLLNPGNLTVPPGAVAFHFSASDPDGDTLIYTATGLPGTVTLNTGTGAVSGSLSAGTYRVTATASDGNLQSRQSFTITVQAAGGGGGGNPCSAPGAPTLRAPSVTGNYVSLSWSPPGSGAAPTSYVLSVGTAPGLANLAVIEAGLAMSIGGALPDGTYFVRAMSRGACGDSIASNEVSFSVGAAVPGAPAGLAFQKAGNVVRLTWGAPASGSSPTAYVIEVGSAPGLANLLVYNTQSTARTIIATAPSGRYFVRVRALSGLGVGAASNELDVSVP